MEEKVYFMPGEVVTLKQDIPNKPVMIVVKKETMNIRTHGVPNVTEDYFKGIRCRWFSTEGVLQEAIYNTKDLLKVEK
jgi:uncharacterized protein YodC (DUF2158 family)|nr:MAG TPA: putative small protein [Caudoviricetes sp.]